MKNKSTLLIIAAVAVLAVIIPLTVVGAVVSGAVLGVATAFNSSTVNCKAPPNIFDLWETFEDFLTGVDCDCTVTTTDYTLDNTKADHASTIISVGKKLGYPEKAIVTALATALTESGLQNYANDGEYNPNVDTLSDATETLNYVKTSLDYPNDAVGSDNSSTGLFQQQVWWGTLETSNWRNDPTATMTRLMDPVWQAEKFYASLGNISGWENMDIGTVAQRIQVSAYPDAYNTKVEEAQNIYNAYQNKLVPVELYGVAGVYSSTATSSVTVSARCGGSSFPGLVMDKTSLYQVTAQWDQPPLSIRGGRAHGGMDIDCGDDYPPVYTPLGGVVLIAVDGNSSGSGEPAGDVRIRLEDGSVLRFHHLRYTFVEPGQVVDAGTSIGECANTGNSFGSHLHLEINVKDSNNAAVKALPAATDLSADLRDPALALDVLGVDICPTYTANRKTVAPGSPLPSPFLDCWPPEEWVK